MQISFQENRLKETVTTYLENIGSEFQNAKLFKSYEDFTDLCTFDVEIEFETVLTEDLVIEKLKTFIPKIKKSVYGFGFLNQYGDIEKLPIHIHVYARQF